MHPPYAVHPSVRWMVLWVLSLEEKTPGPAPPFGYCESGLVPLFRLTKL